MNTSTASPRPGRIGTLTETLLRAPIDTRFPATRMTVFVPDVMRATTNLAPRPVRFGRDTFRNGGVTALITTLTRAIAFGSPLTPSVSTRRPGGRLRTATRPPRAICRPSSLHTRRLDATGPATVDADPISDIEPFESNLAPVRGLSMRTTAGAASVRNRPDEAAVDRNPSLTVTRIRAFAEAAK